MVCVLIRCIHLESERERERERVGGDIDLRFLPFPKALARSETQTISFRIRTRVTDSISDDDNCYAKHAFNNNEVVKLHTHTHTHTLIYIYIYIESILLYRCTSWTLTKRLEKKLDGNYTKMLRAILRRQHPTKQQLYGHLQSITKTIQVRRTRDAGHCRRSRDELISDVLLWTPSHGRAKVGQPARTYIQQLCEDSGV